LAILTLDLFKQLKNGAVECVYLNDKYMLKVDEDRKVYLSRGGKRKYYLENTFVFKYLIKDNSIKEEVNNIYLQEIKELLIELLNNKKLGVKTRSKLIRIDDLVNRVI